jgi:hypothetical protein
MLPSLEINQSNVFIKPFLHQQMSQSAIQKPSLKLQTASNADVEACRYYRLGQGEDENVSEDT